MTGETDLNALMRGMSARLVDGVFVFATVPIGQIPEGLSPRMVFEESEGTTLIVDRDKAAALGLDSTFPCRMITLEVHSSLAAVGFLARITTALAAAGIGVNPVSGYHHDHLFIPEDRAGQVMEVLQRLSHDAGQG